MQISENIKKLSAEIGFSECGIAKSKELTFNKQKLISSLNNGLLADLRYLKEKIDTRSNPALLLNNAKSVIVCIISYNNIKQQNSKYIISKYAYSNDYHVIIKNMLLKLAVQIKVLLPDMNYKIFCDSSPVFEKEWAKNAGLGFIGKNNLLINKKYGSFVFIGGIIIDKEIEPDNIVNLNCGNCNKCINACPTNALQPYLLNINKCISYLTIENKNDEIPNEFKGKFNNIYGCDICQDVCPYNKNTIIENNKTFQVNPYMLWNNEQWENFSEENFNNYFKNSSIKRVGYKKLKRNINNAKN